MGNAQNCICWHRNRHVIISLLLLLISSLTHVRFMAEGRAISKLIEAVQGRIEEVDKVVRVVNRARQIGSRPPRCERRCSGCGHCEAVQVPIVPKFQTHSRSFSVSSSTTRASNKHIANSRGDDISNYKPMSWKCKCGDYLFNP
nr:EPIDERMAL PATTERNING FACTOR-like protein 2 isoform X2 [Ziziphus jujuba var. spinosa]